MVKNQIKYLSNFRVKQYILYLDLFFTNVNIFATI